MQKTASLQPIKVNSVRKLVGIEQHGFISTFFCAINQVGDFFAQHVIRLPGNTTLHRQPVVDGCRRIEWVRIILRECIFNWNCVRPFSAYIADDAIWPVERRLRSDSRAVQSSCWPGTATCWAASCYPRYVNFAK